jgi:hypothetical protein
MRSAMTTRIGGHSVRGPQLDVVRTATISGGSGSVRRGPEAVRTPIGPITSRAAGSSPGLGRAAASSGSAAKIELGSPAGGPSIAISASGRILVGGKLPSASPGKGADATAIYEAGRLVGEQNGVFAHSPLNDHLRARVFDQLSLAIGAASAEKAGAHREKIVVGALALLVDLATSVPKSSQGLFEQISAKVVDTIAALGDVEQRAFYLRSVHQHLEGRLSPEVRAKAREIERGLLPERPLVDEWTEGRTKPLIVRHTIHNEFWKGELAYFSKKNGFELVKKNAKDTERVYKAKLPDPAGKKAPLTVEIRVKKGEIDFLEGMDDPETHVVLYSGHSALGGNGSESIQAAGPMKGKYPKLVMAANCRGKDNYAEFTNKYPRAHVIMTEGPTYSDSGQARIAALFETLARGESYRFMRKQSEIQFWDEPADNYFYPDEWRKFRFIDLDGDGKLDSSAFGSDRFFDLGASKGANKFVRAVAFANSELFYHWEVDHENGKKSYYGKEYGDSLIADGASAGASDRLVEVTASPKGGKKLYRVRYAASRARNMDENLYAGLATMQMVLALAKDKAGKVDLKEALRAVLMGSQAIHYLDVYLDSNPVNQKAFFSKVGLTDEIDPKKVDHIFDAFDANANTAQVKALRALLEKEHKVDLGAWVEGFLAKNAPVEPPLEKVA